MSNPLTFHIFLGFSFGFDLNPDLLAMSEPIPPPSEPITNQSATNPSNKSETKLLTSTETTQHHQQPKLTTTTNHTSSSSEELITNHNHHHRLTNGSANEERGMATVLTNEKAVYSTEVEEEEFQEYQDDYQAGHHI